MVDQLSHYRISIVLVYLKVFKVERTKRRGNLSPILILDLGR